MFRKFIATPPVLLAAVAIKNTDSGPKQHDPEDLSHFVCRRSDLPLYTPLHAINKPKGLPHPSRESKSFQTIENGIRLVRMEVQQGYRAVADKLQVVEHYVDTAKAHTMSTVDYLNEPHNGLPRGGAIAIGGLAGFIFAARGGFIKKVLYTSIGAGSVASICYPKQAEVFAREALLEARRGYVVTYNFIKGVKPGDEAKVEPIAKFPTSLQDVKYLILDMYDEAKEVLFPEKK